VDRFGTVEFDGDQALAASDVREGFRALEAVLEEALKPGREKALVMTKLEEAAMWAVKAIAVEK
jgi:hypothetical protein